jgi:predicted RNase H-like HicB family nuclease
MRKLSYRIILRPEPEGGYTVTVPALPGCITYGKTLEEAKKMALDAIKAYLESLKCLNYLLSHPKKSLGF